MFMHVCEIVDFNFCLLNSRSARSGWKPFITFYESIEQLRETNVITYDMILFVSYDTNGLLDSFKQAIIHTIVDEFQDSNYLVRRVGSSHCGNTINSHRRC